MQIGTRTVLLRTSKDAIRYANEHSNDDTAPNRIKHEHPADENAEDDVLVRATLARRSSVGWFSRMNRISPMPSLHRLQGLCLRTKHGAILFFLTRRTHMPNQQGSKSGSNKGQQQAQMPGGHRSQAGSKSGSRSKSSSSQGKSSEKSSSKKDMDSQ